MKKENKSDILYSLKDVSFRYLLGSQEVPALASLSLDIMRHSLVTFSGPSGSGKSTLLHLLGLIEPAQEGDIFFEQENLQAMSHKRKNEIRKLKIGFIFQQFHLIPVLSAEENVEYFLKRQGIPKEERELRVRESLESVGLLAHAKKKPGELSGGQKQRVAIARALAKRPEVIIADEPTASLDQKTGREIMDILSQLVRNKKVTVILTTHDPMVHAYSQKDFHLCDGQLTKES